MKKLLLIGALICAFGAIAFSSVRAQVAPLSATAQGSSINLSPRYPGPGEEVVASINPHQIYQPTARVVWTLGGKVVQEKVGEFSYTFTVGKIGSTIDLAVSVYPEDGVVMRASIKQVVGAVSLVWEADTYTPPFFKGRALMGPGAEVRIQALPLIGNGAVGYANPQDLVFSWSVNGESNPSVSGLGVDTITAAPKDLYGALLVNVRIEDKTGVTLATGGITVPVTPPKVLLMLHSDVIGIRTTPIGQRYQLGSSEKIIFAEPYFASARTRTDARLKYTWNIDGQSINGAGSVGVRPEGEGSGAALVEVSIINTEKIAQRMGARSVVQFESTQSTQNAETTPI